ncbi:MAG TPA: hypothetical protein VJ723_12385 [Candidatus Angelobacter sp.]|nr:hypothetical protein [Candidatus Angelobacter sp.]
MELILNLVWLGVCICLLIVSGPLLKKPAAGQARGVTVVALVCLMCLLFPAISITDDLQDNPALVEVTKLKKLACAGPAVMAMLPLIALHVPQPAIWATHSLDELSLPQLRLFTTDLSRRPPPSILSSLFFV